MCINRAGADTHADGVASEHVKALQNVEIYYRCGCSRGGYCVYCHPLALLAIHCNLLSSGSPNTADIHIDVYKYRVTKCQAYRKNANGSPICPEINSIYTVVAASINRSISVAFEYFAGKDGCVLCSFAFRGLHTNHDAMNSSSSGSA